MDEAIAGKLAQRTGVVSDQLAELHRSLPGGGSDKSVSLASEEAGTSEEAVTRNSLGGGRDLGGGSDMK